MEVTMRGITALKRLRQQLQEDASYRFPHDTLIQLLVLYDVCRSLDLNLFQAKEVLGELGWSSVMEYINGPACESVNWERLQQLNP
jgi:hypothetical protein